MPVRTSVFETDAYASSATSATFNNYASVPERPKLYSYSVVRGHSTTPARQYAVKLVFIITYFVAANQQI